MSLGMDHKSKFVDESGCAQTPPGIASPTSFGLLFNGSVEFLVRKKESSKSETRLAIRASI